MRGDQEIELAAISKKLLELLMRNSHRVVPKLEIEKTIWGIPPDSRDLVRIHVHTLRDAIDKPFATPLLHTIRGIGYRLYADLETVRQP
jgi:DNA-binding response OmpR family regulator